jgi:hypothetical protein
MKKYVMKRVVLIASVMALAVVAVPAMASATPVWGPVGSSASLDASNFSMNTSAFGWTCQKVHLGVHTRKPASSTLDVTAATFTNCIGNGSLAGGCSVNQTATGLPWTAEALGGTAVKINVANVNMTLVGSCPYAGATTFYSGPLTPGTWTAAMHKLQYTSSGGLFVSGIGSSTVTASFVDPLSVLTLA